MGPNNLDPHATTATYSELKCVEPIHPSKKNANLFLMKAAEVSSLTAKLITRIIGLHIAILLTEI